MLIYHKTYQDNDGNTRVLMQLWTACCKDLVEFIKLPDGNYINVKMGNIVADGWKDQINKAIEQQSKLIK